MLGSAARFNSQVGLIVPYLINQSSWSLRFSDYIILIAGNVTSLQVPFFWEPTLEREVFERTEI